MDGFSFVAQSVLWSLAGLAVLLPVLSDPSIVNYYFL